MIDEKKMMAIEEKMEFLTRLSAALRSDQRLGVDALVLHAEQAGDTGYCKESIIIEFTNGYSKEIDTTANSNLGNMIAVAKALM